MTIREFVLKQKNMDINDWILVIEKEGLQKYQHTIIECANHYNKIIVNHNATFGPDSINSILNTGKK